MICIFMATISPITTFWCIPNFVDFAVPDIIFCSHAAFLDKIIVSAVILFVGIMKVWDFQRIVYHPKPAKLYFLLFLSIHLVRSQFWEPVFFFLDSLWLWKLHATKHHHNKYAEHISWNTCCHYEVTGSCNWKGYKSLHVKICDKYPPTILQILKSVYLVEISTNHLNNLLPYLLTNIFRQI